MNIQNIFGSERVPSEPRGLVLMHLHIARECRSVRGRMCFRPVLKRSWRRVPASGGWRRTRSKLQMLNRPPGSRDGPDGHGFGCRSLKVSQDLRSAFIIKQQPGKKGADVLVPDQEVSTKALCLKTHRRSAASFSDLSR